MPGSPLRALPHLETEGSLGANAADPPSPWSALLRDNLNADEVAGFLSNAIARKEASIMGGSGSPVRRQSGANAQAGLAALVPPMSTSSAATTRVSDAALRSCWIESQTLPLLLTRFVNDVACLARTIDNIA